MVTFEAIERGEAQVYPAYTGTVGEVVLKTGERNFQKINSDLKKKGIEMLSPLGFHNSYAIAVRKSLAHQLNLKTISDLSHKPQLRGGLSFEFQERKDGWKALKKTYGLKQSIEGIEIPLTYEALKNNEVDFAESYSTEPLLKKYDLIILEDDKKFFPKYEAVPLVNSQLSAEIKSILNELGGTITNEIIMDLNGQLSQGASFGEVASEFLIKQDFMKKTIKKENTAFMDWSLLFTRTKTHIYLTLLAVFLGALVTIPLAILMVPYKRFANLTLGFTGLLQTIPSIALLSFMIPLFGIGFLPALVGLFFYSLLPILQNTYVALSTIEPRLIMVARGIGLRPMEIFLSVKLPLALPTILAGIRTATILNIGTATLGAFIGAGGLGEPIVAGLALNDTSLVLQGALPAALLAIFLDRLFALLNLRFMKRI